MGSRGPLPQNKTKTALRFAPGAPEPPDWLDAEAKKEYRRTVKILAENPGHLAQTDLGVLASYAQSYSDLARLTVELRTTGEYCTSAQGNVHRHPLVEIRDKAAHRMQILASKLGFSPSDRQRLGSTMAAPQPRDRFDAYLDNE